MLDVHLLEMILKTLVIHLLLEQKVIITLFLSYSTKLGYDLFHLDFLNFTPEGLNKENIRKYIKSVYDWLCVLLNTSKPPSYFLSTFFVMNIYIEVLK